MAACWPMPELSFTLLDEDSFDAIPAPAHPGARCQTCDYWERLDGRRDNPEGPPARELKRSRLLAGARLAGAAGPPPRRGRFGGGGGAPRRGPAGPAPAPPPPPGGP